MKRETSLYLDLVRFTASLMVFLDHVGSGVISGGFLWRFMGLGSPAVIVFFVLSGWVIAYVVDRGESTPKDYFVARAARIYSVALPAIALVLVLDAVGGTFRPDLYARLEATNPNPGHPFLSIILSAFFLNAIWNVALAPGTDGPYWSLGYECPYYLMAGLALFLSGRTRVVAIALTGLLVGPHVLSLFPIWLLGFGCYRLTGKKPIPFRYGSAMFAASTIMLAVLVAGIVLRKIGMMPPIGGHGPKDVLVDYGIGLLVAVHLVGASAISQSWGWIRLVARPIRWLAGATFSLYLFHLPILIFINAVLPLRQDSWTFRLILVAGTLALVFLLAELTERRKAGWRQLFDRLASPAAAMRT